VRWEVRVSMSGEVCGAVLGAVLGDVTGVAGFASAAVGAAARRQRERSAVAGRSAVRERAVRDIRESPSRVLGAVSG
jgi:hypothetical protein